MLVIDASVAVELALDRAGTDATARFGDPDLVAPALLWSEASSVLSELAHRGSISRDLASRALDRLVNAELGIVERRAENLLIEAWRVADEFGWAKTYDAEYVALAGLLGCRLVTLDLRLRRGTERLGFVVTPTEL